MDILILLMQLIGGSCLAYYLINWGIYLWRGKAVADPRLLAAVLMIYGFGASVTALGAFVKVLTKMVGVA